MKITRFTALAILLVLTRALSAQSGVSESPMASTILVGLRGDYNNDGVVNVVDAVLLQELISGERAYDGCEAFLDVNGDGFLSPLDVLAVLQWTTSTSLGAGGAIANELVVCVESGDGTLDGVESRLLRPELVVVDNKHPEGHYTALRGTAVGNPGDALLVRAPATSGGLPRTPLFLLGGQEGEEVTHVAVPILRVAEGGGSALAFSHVIELPRPVAITADDVVTFDELVSTSSYRFVDCPSGSDAESAGAPDASAFWGSETVAEFWGSETVNEFWGNWLMRLRDLQQHYDE